MDGVWFAGHAALRSPIGWGERPEAYDAGASLDAAASTQGSYAVTADAEAPHLWPGWRAALTLSATRDNRLGYYGVGNTSPYSADSISASSPYFYRVSRTRLAARGAVQRQVIGPVRVLVGAEAVRTDFRTLPGTNQFGRDLQSGAIDSTQVPFNDAFVRAGVVLDLRDNELDPHTGALVELLYAGGKGYTRATASARAWAHPLERLLFAGRIATERLSDGAPLAAQQVMESSEQPVVAVGGFHSLRGYYDDRFVGPGKLVGGVEARYALLWAPTLLQLEVGAFYDAGRVFGPGESVTVTTTGLHHAAGGELALRFTRNTLLVASYARGSEGGQFQIATTWSY